MFLDSDDNEHNYDMYAPVMERLQGLIIIKREVVFDITESSKSLFDLKIGGLYDVYKETFEI